MPQAQAKVQPEVPLVNVDYAQTFFTKTLDAYRAGDMKNFEAYRTCLLINLGLSTEKSVA
jgi:hypothetical protein